MFYVDRNEYHSAFVKSHHLRNAEAGHSNASGVMAVEVKAVEGHQQPQIDTGHPHQYCVLETLGQVWVGCVPRTVPVLQQQKREFQSQKFRSREYIHLNRAVRLHPSSDRQIYYESQVQRIQKLRPQFHPSGQILTVCELEGFFSSSKS